MEMAIVENMAARSAGVAVAADAENDVGGAAAAGATAAAGGADAANPLGGTYGGGRLPDGV